MADTAMAVTAISEGHWFSLEPMTWTEPIEMIATGHQGINSMSPLLNLSSRRRREMEDDTTSSTPRRTRPGEGESAMWSTSTCLRWGSRSWPITLHKRREDELGAHYTCNLGFESQGDGERKNSPKAMEKNTEDKMGTSEASQNSLEARKSYVLEKENEQAIMMATIKISLEETMCLQR